MLKAYEEYKNADIPWCTEIPFSWSVNRGKAIFNNPKEINKDGLCGNVLSLTLKGVIRNNRDNPVGLTPKSYETYQIFEKNNLVFKLIDLENISTSRVGLVKEKGIMSPAYIRIELKNIESYNMKFFFYQYYSMYKRNIFNGLGAGVRQTLSGDDLLVIKIAVPPKPEQDQIVRYLDWKTSEMNRFIHQKKKQIKMLEELKCSKINELITKGINKNTVMKDSGIEWIGQIPENWQIDHIKQHFTIKKRIAGKEGYAVLSITQQGIKEKDISSNEGQMAQSYANYQFVYPGDFAMNHMDLLTGYVDISKQFGVTSPDYRVFVLSDTEHCYAPFYLRVFQIGYKRRIFYKFGKGAAHQGRWRLPKTAFYDFAIQVPPIEEQKIIEKKCKDIEKKIDEMIFGLRKEIELVEELKVRLISDVVTGQVDVRNEVIPNYEVDSSDDEVEDDVDEESTDENIDEE